jgi:hypothetical protein
VGAEVSVVREAMKSQPTGTTIHRKTLPSAIAITSSSAIGFVRIVRRADRCVPAGVFTAEERVSLS